MRPPRKFTDETRSQITPEWLEWFKQDQADIQPDLEAHVMSSGQPLENHWPEQYDKEVGDGAWILVVEEPHTELRHRFRVPTPSLWWARAEQSRPGSLNIGTNARPKVVPGRYRVVIETPGGSLWLFPHEYVVCSNPMTLICDPEVTIHRLGDVDLDEDKQEQMFYLQSRGLSRQDALLSIMNGIDMRDWGWVEFPDYAIDTFAGVGARR